MYENQENMHFVSSFCCLKLIPDWKIHLENPLYTEYVLSISWHKVSNKGNWNHYPHSYNHFLAQC